MAEPTALPALALDAMFGWPAWLYARIGHPVGVFAWVIGRCETRWNRPGRSDAARRALGLVTVILLAGGTALAGFVLEAIIGRVAGAAAWPLVAVVAWPALAQRSLNDHFLPVLTALEHDDLAAARQAVSMIVGRDTVALDRAGVSRAAIESLAESFCDGIVAPLFWLLVAGLPGIWTYKAVNTADSLIGHPEEATRAFGWAAARSDDVLNLLPARLSALLICLAAGRGWRVCWRDHGKHASPNAGWPEAAMAGALRIGLAGPVSYDGHLQNKPWIGEGEPAGPVVMRRSRIIYLRACGLLWLIAGACAWRA
ncbi:adenosylcobinamide-phosphate synthase CbiB [Novosphingobium sp.]|uniref:adenosylcobinamide-phosphate synthase CbiB n=1 Tax=Novosphingobium sp. TaxID=1874826 RepID=UPI002B45B3B3|nr:adenosylcobinamide-phosphate synthase CbiB [Novosphingobium sp.]HKR93499.1 adenosylcobinamide-phosphate synthase CbiB [Novosphingobium sp.]